MAGTEWSLGTCFVIKKLHKLNSISSLIPSHFRNIADICFPSLSDEELFHWGFRVHSRGNRPYCGMFIDHIRVYIIEEPTHANRGLAGEMNVIDSYAGHENECHEGSLITPALGSLLVPLVQRIFRE
jgi:hypothetical protein